jgi:hypothetical protein
VTLIGQFLSTPKFGGMLAAVEGITALQQQRQVEVIALQDIYEPWGG